jgi:hypothetical protein
MSEENLDARPLTSVELYVFSEVFDLKPTSGLSTRKTG